MIVACVLLILSAIPAALFVLNLRRYRSAPDESFPCERRVTVLIPARNEERSISDALDSILRCYGVELEVFVLDDASTDRTATVVAEFAARDQRVHLVRGRGAAAGMGGKAACLLATGAKIELRDALLP